MNDLKQEFRVLDDVPFTRSAPDPTHSPATPPIDLEPSAARRAGTLLLVIAVVAVAGVFVWRAFAPRTSLPSTPGSGTVYRDPQGWMVDVPRGWYVVPFDLVADGGRHVEGAQVSNVALPKLPSVVSGSPVQVNDRDLPATGIALTVALDSDLLKVPMLNARDLPISMGDFSEGSAPAGSPTLDVEDFLIGGKAFSAAVKTGPHASRAAIASMQQVVRSIRTVETTPTPAIRPQAERVYIHADITNRSLHRDITPPSDAPAVSEDQALDAAWARMGNAHPERVVVTYVDWNGRPVWVVSFEGGDTCTPALGPSPAPGQSANGVCVDNVLSVRIDAKSGEWLDTFSDGFMLSENDLRGSASQTEIELLRGNPGESPPAAVQQTIVVNQGAPDGTDRIVFAPPSQEVGPDLMTSNQAIATFRKADPHFVDKPNMTAQLGLYTSASGPDTYRFRDRLAWGYSWDTTCAPSPNPVDSSSSPSTCTSWLFLDAHTGEMLEADG